MAALDRRNATVGDRVRQAGGPLVSAAGAPHTPTPSFPSVPAPILVVVIDANLLVAESLSVMLDANKDLTVVAIAGTCADGLVAVTLHQPAVVVLHQQLPDGLGTDSLNAMFAACPTMKALILSADDRDEVLVRALRAGAAGVISKTDRGATLIKAVLAVAHDEAIITPDALRRLIHLLKPTSTCSDYELTAREHEILAFLAAGRSTCELASALTIAPTTARNHIQSIMRKLGAHSRLEAVCIALRENIQAP